MYCLDTDIVISFLKNDFAAVSRVKKLQSLGEDIAITTLTLCELYKGAFLSVKSDESLGFVNKFLETVTLLPQSKTSCLLFGQDYAHLKKNGLMTQLMDLMIATVCKANNRTLITRNIKDFKNIPDLVVNAW